MAADTCDWCMNFVEDPETGERYCAVDLDEDEMVHFLSSYRSSCPYYRPGDEYRIVQKQN